VLGSLLAFVGVYLIVLGAGISYLLRLMRIDPDAPLVGRPEGPMRAAGITPIQATHGPAGRDR
jgi:cytochrome d ubiquinol oxidase subunit I